VVLKKVQSAEVHVSNIKKEKASKRRSVKLTPAPGPLENIFDYNEEVVKNREKKKSTESFSRRNSSEIEKEENEDESDENGESFGSEISEGDSLMNTSEYDDGENIEDENDSEE